MYKKLLLLLAFVAFSFSFAADPKGKSALVDRTQYGRERLIDPDKGKYIQKSVRDCAGRITVQNGVLDLSRQRITSLDGLSDYPNRGAITDLIVSENLIEEISPEQLNGMPLLRRLNLSDNMLGQLPANIFSNLRELRVVILARNKIREVHENAFMDCNLHHINLQNNQLTEFHPDLISEQIELMTLRLAYNGLSLEGMAHLVYEYYSRLLFFF